MSLATTLRGALRDASTPDDAASQPEVGSTPALPADGKRTAKAVEVLEQEQARLGTLEAARSARQAELAGLQARTADDVLAADDAELEQVAGTITVARMRLREQLETDQLVIDRVRGRISELRRGVVEAERADLAELLEQARRRKAEHDNKLDKLLAAVTEHDGATYKPVEPLTSVWAAQGVLLADPVAEQSARRPSRSAMLAREISELELRVEILDDALAGRGVPVFRNHMQLPPHLFSPRLKGPDAYVEFAR